MEDLYLPPRSRKTLQQLNQGEGIFRNTLYLNVKYVSERMNVILYLFLGKSKKRKKVQDDSDDEDSGSEAEGSDDDRPKKRGRPRVMPRESIKSFTDVEVCNEFHFIRNGLNFRTFLIHL